MQKTWAEAEDRGYAFAVAHVRPESLQQGFVFGVHLDIGKQGEIVASAETRNMRPQVVFKRAIRASRLGQSGSIFFVGKELDTCFFKDRIFGGKRTFRLVLGGELLSDDLARFDVGLVESIDADDRSGDCSSDLPAEEFLSEVVGVSDGDADDGLSGF